MGKKSSIIQPKASVQDEDDELKGVSILCLTGSRLYDVCVSPLFLTHFGVSVAMNNHWQGVVHCVSNSHSVCSKLEKHFICQKREHDTFEGQVRKIDLPHGRELQRFTICRVSCQDCKFSEKYAISHRNVGAKWGAQSRFKCSAGNVI